MTTQTIHPPTSTGTGSHRRPIDPQVHIDAIREVLRAPVSDAEERVRLESLLADHRAVIERQSQALAVLGHRLVEAEAERDAALREVAALRAQLVQHAYADRVRSHEYELLGENRALRAGRESDQDVIKKLRARLAELEQPRGRRRRTSP